MIDEWLLDDYNYPMWVFISLGGPRMTSEGRIILQPHLTIPVHCGPPGHYPRAIADEAGVRDGAPVVRCAGSATDPTQSSANGGRDE